MRPLKNFEEYLNLGVIKKITPDIIRAKSLIEEAKKRKKFINELSEKIGLKDENANYFIENSYDVLNGLNKSQVTYKRFQLFWRRRSWSRGFLYENLGFFWKRNKILEWFKIF